MAKEERNIPATKGDAKATLTQEQSDSGVWQVDGWTVGKAPKGKDDDVASIDDNGGDG